MLNSAPPTGGLRGRIHYLPVFCVKAMSLLPPLFVDSIVYSYQHKLVYTYFILSVIILCYASYFVASMVPDWVAGNCNTVKTKCIWSLSQVLGTELQKPWNFRNDRSVFVMLMK